MFGLPFFDTGLVCRLDWLHAADLGVSADWVGQLFVSLLPNMLGGNLNERIRDLWSHIQEGYRRHPWDSKLDKLTPGMRSMNANAPKLKAHASEVRGLIPIALDLAEAHLDDADPLGNTAKQCMRELAACYANLSAGSSAADLANHSRRFATLYTTLEGRAPEWWVRPKLHMFQELCEMDGTRPANHWT